jgi:hypothetical protein
MANRMMLINKDLKGYSRAESWAFRDVVSEQTRVSFNIYRYWGMVDRREYR